MKNLVLIKGMDYRGHGIFAKKGKVFPISDDKAKVLLETGFFSEDTSSKVTDPKITSENNRKPVEQMKKDELIAYAKEKGIDISDCSNNDNRIEKIKAIEAEGNDDGNDEDNSNDNENDNGNSDDNGSDNTGTPEFDE